DWFNFANPFRGWGRSGGYFSDSSRGLCGNAETCTIYDWRLMAGSRAMNVSFDGANQNTAFNGDGGPCTSNALQSDVVLTISGKTFMKHAMEINDDMTGNDDGLCESGED